MTPEEHATLGAEAGAIEGEHIPAAEKPPEPEPEAIQPTTGQVLTMLLRPMFDIMAPAWEVTDAECSMLGECYGAVADKYFPNFALGVEANAIVATLMVFGPRWKKPPKVEPTPPPAEKKPEDAPAEG